jgi:type VI protein secretion system component VasK
MIDLIPNWFWTLVLWAGVLAIIASYVAGKLPIVAQYKLPLRIGGVVATLVGVYFYGVIANEAKWQARVTELEHQVKAAEVQSEQTNQKLAAALDDNKKLVQSKGKEVIKYIDKWRTKEILKEVQGAERIRVEEVIKYVESCPVPKEFIDIHNKSAAKPGDAK